MPANLQEEIRNAINRVSAENGSDTPDYILAQFLVGCLNAYNKAVCARELWLGHPIVVPRTASPAFKADDEGGA